jgi:hypothetical protein
MPAPSADSLVSAALSKVMAVVGLIPVCIILLILDQLLGTELNLEFPISLGDHFIVNSLPVTS